MNIVIYRDIVVTVEPKRIALAKATDELNAGGWFFYFIFLSNRGEGGRKEREERERGKREERERLFVYIDRR